MSKYITKRLLISLATLLVIIFVLFVMLDLMPGSPFNDEKLTEAQKVLLYAKYGLDQPFFVRFGKYLINMLKGDLGVSYVLNKKVKRLALKSALSAKAAENEIVVVDGLKMDEIKTKTFAGFLSKLGVEGNGLSRSAGEAVEDEAHIGVGLLQAVDDQADDNVVGHELASIHI